MTATTAPLPEPKQRRWHPWPVGIVIYFASFVVMVIIFAIMASDVRFDLVAEDYYEQEVNYQSHMEAVRRAKSLDPGLEMNRQGNTLVLTFPPGHVPDTGLVHFYCPSNSDWDKRVTLSVNEVNQCLLSVDLLNPARYDVNVYWTTNGAKYFQESRIWIEK